MLLFSALRHFRVRRRRSLMPDTRATPYAAAAMSFASIFCRFLLSSRDERPLFESAPFRLFRRLRRRQMRRQNIFAVFCFHFWPQVYRIASGH